MNNRTRIINTILGKPVDRAPFFFHFGIWGETETRWRKEGLGPDKAWSDGIDFDSGFLGINDMANPNCVNLGFDPWFDNEVIEETETRVIMRDIFGAIVECQKTNESLPRHLEHPVTDRESWEFLKERLNPHSPSRFPENFGKIAEEYNQSDKFIIMGDYPFGLFGVCRELMGVEEFLVSCYTQPDLIHDMMDYLTDFWLEIYSKIVKYVKVDCVHMWEDMSGQSGSLLSPKMVREFMVPNYKKIKDFCDRHNIPIFSVDTDGDVRQLIEPFMEAGVNFLYPFEVLHDYDTIEYRKKYPTLGMMGGIDKMEIAKGKEAIDRLVEKAGEMLKLGRYIPAPDHAVPPEVSYDNFLYFAGEMEKLIKGS
jgi:uroporphyrinogen-III decarboxylase